MGSWCCPPSDLSWFIRSTTTWVDGVDKPANWAFLARDFESWGYQSWTVEPRKAATETTSAAGWASSSKIFQTYASTAGWWYDYPSEKYESQLGLQFPIYGKMKVMFQSPPTRLGMPATRTGRKEKITKNHDQLGTVPEQVRRFPQLLLQGCTAHS